MRLGVALVGLGLGLGVGACDAPAPPTAELAQPVVGAEVTTGDPGVVALIDGGGTGYVFCTGTLVSPRVILTAGHCIDDAMGSVVAHFGDYTEVGGLRIGAVATLSHPNWNGNLNNGHDVGVVLLSVAQDPALAVPMNTTPLDTMIGADYRVVGFGIHDRVTREIDGRKRTAMMRIAGIAGLNGDYVEVTDPDPTMDPDTAICQGDSGGPGLIDVGGVEMIAGVHSYSIEGCFNPSGDSRVDVLIDFIQPYIDQNDPACGEDGQCIRVGCSADPDCEPCGADGTCTASCPLPDPDCPTQAVGEICRADSQCMSGICIPWTLDPRVHFCSQPCDAGCPDGMSCATIPPHGPVCFYDGRPPGALGAACDEPTDCAEYLCEDGACTYTCSIPQNRLCETGFTCEDHGMGARCYGEPPGDDEGGGGCAATRSAAPGALALVLAALALVVVVRRRRC
jgi:hypothetical protein